MPRMACDDEEGHVTDTKWRTHNLTLFIFVVVVHYMILFSKHCTENVKIKQLSKNMLINLMKGLWWQRCVPAKQREITASEFVMAVER